MAVGPSTVVGTLGGGHLEHEAIARARAMLGPRGAGAHLKPLQPVLEHSYTLGPSLGQCCGGAVDLRFEPIAAGPLPADVLARLQRPAMPVALFGGGHVGRALIHVLGTLPVQVTWIDSRDSIFPESLPLNVRCEHSQPVQGAVPPLAPGSRVLIMSFSHAEDLDVLQACLRRRRERADLPFIGLIGSKTKWATFAHRLRERGFSRQEVDGVVCPIGLPDIPGKEPEVIAVSVAAQLLQLRPKQDEAA